MERKSYESGLDSEVSGRLVRGLMEEGEEGAGIVQWVSLKGEGIFPEGGGEGMDWRWH